jgi:hypothetical protein
MRIIISLFTPVVLLAQPFSNSVHTTFQLRYQPIALIATSIPVLRAEASVANEAGLGIDRPNLERDFTELFVTISKHNIVDVVLRKLPSEIVDVYCTAQKVDVAKGSYSAANTFLATSMNQVLFSTGGLCTGTQSGGGIPIMFAFQSYSDYSLLFAGDHNVNFLLQVL